MHRAGIVRRPWAWERLQCWANTGKRRFKDGLGVTRTGVAIGISGIMLLACAVHVHAQDVSAEEDVETARAELLKRWETDGLVKPRDVDAMAKSIFDRPLAEQAEEDLVALAKQANAAANFVGHILNEYQDYRRDNYRYDFVVEKLAPFHDAYVELSNRMKSYRNQVYFNLGRKAAERGDEIAAFFYFRDAYRLSTFTEGQATREGMRYRSEIEMKKLLGIEQLGTFVFWK